MTEEKDNKWIVNDVRFIQRGEKSTDSKVIKQEVADEVVKDNLEEVKEWVRENGGLTLSFEDELTQLKTANDYTLYSLSTTHPVTIGLDAKDDPISVHISVVMFKGKLE